MIDHTQLILPHFHILNMILGLMHMSNRYHHQPNVSNHQATSTCKIIHQPLFYIYLLNTILRIMNVTC